MDLQTLYKAVDDRQPDMLRLWADLVNCDCGFSNKAGVDAVGHYIADFLENLQIPTRFAEFSEAGNTLIAEYGDMTKPYVIFTGHMDTVFPKGTAVKRPFLVKDGKAYGPGVLDMKGGITILLTVIQILAEQGYQSYPIKIILAGDEETGHRNSTAAQTFTGECQGAIAGFNFETGFRDNSIVVERKGVFQSSFEVFGKGAHAGNAPEEGRSAIREIAHKILDIEALTDFNAGNTCNVGVISGGTVPNAIPDYAKIDVDVRFASEEGLTGIKSAFQRIAEKVYIEGTSTIWTEQSLCMAMPRLAKTMELFETARRIAIESGFPDMTPIRVGGGSDSAYLANAGVPTLCAMGVKGMGNHTTYEEADVVSLLERTKLMLTILDKL